MSDFDLLDRPKVWVPIKWPALELDEEGGTREVEKEVEVLAEILDRPEIEAQFTTDGSTLRDEMTFEDFKLVFSDWRGIVMGQPGNKKPVPFEDEYIEKFLAVPAVSHAAMATYIAACAGKVRTREGNSEGSPANGQAGGPQNRHDRRAKAATKAK